MQKNKKAENSLKRIQHLKSRSEEKEKKRKHRSTYSTDEISSPGDKNCLQK